MKDHEGPWGSVESSTIDLEPIAILVLTHAAVGLQARKNCSMTDSVAQTVTTYNAMCRVFESSKEPQGSEGNPTKRSA